MKPPCRKVMIETDPRVVATRRFFWRCSLRGTVLSHLGGCSVLFGDTSCPGTSAPRRWSMNGGHTSSALRAMKWKVHFLERRAWSKQLLLAPLLRGISFHLFFRFLPIISCGVIVLLFFIFYVFFSLCPPPQHFSIVHYLKLYIYTTLEIVLWITCKCTNQNFGFPSPQTELSLKVGSLNFNHSYA